MSVVQQGQHDGQHTDIQLNDTQHYNKNLTLSIKTITIATEDTECCYPECRYAECHGATSKSSIEMPPKVTSIMTISIMTPSIIIKHYTKHYDNHHSDTDAKCHYAECCCAEGDGTTTRF
jgi:hypothetical protein